MNKYVRLTHVKRLWSQIPCSNDWVYFLRVDLFLRSQILQINRICKYVTTTTYQIWCIALTSSSRVTQSNSSGYFLKIHIKRWKFVWSTSRMFFSLLYMHFCLFIKILHCRTCLSKCIILSRFNKHYLFFYYSVCKDPRHYNNTDALELWAFCLLQTENYTLAKQKIEHAIKVAITVSK